MKRNELLEGGKFALGLTLGGFGALLASMFLGYFGFEVFDNDTLLGAIVGGILAGSFSLIATVSANYQLLMRTNEERERVLEASLTTTLIKVFGFVDTATKCYRHYLDSSPELSLFYSNKRLAKPLKYVDARVSFSEDEKLAITEFRKAELFNSVLDIESLSDSLMLLLEDYEAAFDGIMLEMKEQGAEINGRHVSGSFRINPLQVMEVENYQEHLISALWRLFPKVTNTLKELTDVLEERFGRKFQFEVTELTSRAPNFFEGSSTQEMMERVHNFLSAKDAR